MSGLCQNTPVPPRNANRIRRPWRGNCQDLYSHHKTEGPLAQWSGWAEQDQQMLTPTLSALDTHLPYLIIAC